MKKSLHYGYPTSPIADKLKMNKGVWYVKVGEKVVAPFNNDQRWEALEYFESLPNEIDIHNSFTRESLPFLKENYGTTK